jgi:UDP:flavonoid glycosyltransferase YjiC (YdhE family)
MTGTGLRSRPGRHRRGASRGAIARIPQDIAGAAARGRVAVVGASVGQGHDGAARELARRLAVSGVDVTVHDYLDALPAVARSALRDLYAPTVQYLPAVFDGLFRRLERPGTLRRLARWTSALARPQMARWAAGADAVVSTYPLAGQTLGDLRRDGLVPGTSITYLTDPAAHVLWCHPDVDLHLTVTRATARDAARYGVTAEVAGPLCAPGFGHPERRRALRAELGIPGDAPVALIGAGSLGLGDVPRTVAAILHHPRAHAVVLCGRNVALRRRMAGDPRVVPLGWRDDVADLMAAADLLVHNAGGLSLTEALVAGLPAVTYLPIPGHGRANATVLDRAGVAAWPRDPHQLADAIERIASATPRPLPMPAWPAGADPAVVVVREIDRARTVRRDLAARVSGF